MDIKPCPICGPERQELVIEHRPSMFESDPLYWFSIECRKCKSSSAYWPSDEASIRHWNTMADWIQYEENMEEIKRETVTTGPLSIDQVTMMDAMLSRTSSVEPGQESSVEISQNAKGEPRVSVKIYHADPEQAAIDAVALYRRTLAALASGSKV
jgi:hypothetical protein